MTSIVGKLHALGLLNAPKWLPNNTMFEGMTGSEAYGVSSGGSDVDVYGFCMPPKDMVFPHLAGEIMGFGRQIKRFDQYQQHHIEVKDRRKVYDLTIFSIVKFFQLCMENNPNMVDALFLPQRCVLHSTAIYVHVRENRRLFLHKGGWHKFRGYAFAQMSKIDTGANKANQKRQETIERFGFDTKFAYHLVRLMLEIEQILAEHDLDIERNADTLKTIRAGAWSLDEIKRWFGEKERSLEGLYATSTLPFQPDETAIKRILLDCMEMHYGSLSAVITKPDASGELLREMRLLVEKYS